MSRVVDVLVRVLGESEHVILEGVQKVTERFERLCRNGDKGRNLLSSS